MTAFTSVLFTQVNQTPSVIDARYMVLPIADGFAWKAYFADTPERDWYLVVFRSKHCADADEILLERLDTAAGHAAQASDGFVCYFPGVPSQTGECLSFCLWEDEYSAKQGSTHPIHREAAEKGVGQFAYYRLERYRVSKRHDMICFEPVVSERHAHSRAM